MFGVTSNDLKWTVFFSVAAAALAGVLSIFAYERGTVSLQEACGYTVGAAVFVIWISVVFLWFRYLKNKQIGPKTTEVRRWWLFGTKKA
ncbi:hypothetical protein COT29_01160 [Candidatus Micrarchaeota archaeon CG08_land_8_20_14_0_20_59_11]|nr:MAG: hypothetical protein COT29_01160 [Candidatus Micrarchaeota archaeon CG08_land_8_20_14_0_20_59_11]